MARGRLWTADDDARISAAAVQYRQDDAEFDKRRQSLKDVALQIDRTYGAVRKRAHQIGAKSYRDRRQIGGGRPAPGLGMTPKERRRRGLCIDCGAPAARDPTRSNAHARAITEGRGLTSDVLLRGLPFEQLTTLRRCESCNEARNKCKCGENWKATGRQRCQKCLDAQVKSHQTLREGRGAKGLCGKCGKNSPVPGLARCRECLDAKAEDKRERRERRRAKGKCGTCGKNWKVPGRLTCQKCLDAKAEDKRERRERRRAG